MKSSAVLAAVLAAMRIGQAVAEEDVVVWTTVVKWVNADGADADPTPAPKPVHVDVKQAVHVNNKAAVVNKPVVNKPVVKKPVVKADTGPVKVNIKLAGHDGPIPTGLKLPTGNEPVFSSGGDKRCDPSGGFEEGTCNGPGLNIKWVGDSVPYQIQGGASGTTTGCTNLGPGFNKHVALEADEGTWFEANMDNGVFFDVSYISGFSHPMVCSSSGQKSGCSIDLHSTGETCPQPHATNKQICVNPVGMYGDKDPGGFKPGMSPGSMPWCGTCSAPDPFFQHCSGAAYTYPYDDGATRKGSTTVTCCIGTTCGCTGREGSTKQGNPQPTRDGGPCVVCPGNKYWARDNGSDLVKKDLEEVLNPAPMTPSLLPRKHKRHQHQHRHAAVHENRS